MNDAALHAFAGYGVELEYMIVGKETLSILPIADALLRKASGNNDHAYVTEVKRGRLAWSNELALHLVELKNWRPDAELAMLPVALHAYFPDREPADRIGEGAVTPSFINNIL